MKTLKILSAVAVLSGSLMAVNVNSCKGCHGSDFSKKALGKSLNVAEMSKEDITSSLKGYKDGTYGGIMKGVMKGQVSKYEDIDLEKIAEVIYKINHKEDTKAEVVEPTIVPVTPKTTVEELPEVENGNVTKGLKLYSKKLKKKIGVSGSKFAALHSQDEWEELFSNGGKPFIKEMSEKYPEAEKVLNSEKFKKKYIGHIKAFVIEYANDSGNVPSC